MIRAVITKIQLLVDGGHFFQAQRAAQLLIEEYPDCVDAWMLIVLCAQRLRHFELMCHAAEQAMRMRPDHDILRFKYVEALVLCGRGSVARAELVSAEVDYKNQVGPLCRIAELYSESGEHRARMRCAQRALTLCPGDHHLLANLAAAETACGMMAEAETHLDQLLHRYPHEHGARYRRSTLRRQAAENNHIQELETALSSADLPTSGIVPLCYALAKEHEDLGRHEQMFDYLKRGADQRRKQMSYSVSEDEEAMSAIIKKFDDDMLQSETNGCQDVSAIFVMGLPRSGTTLVDRILSSHSSIHSLGEINDLANTLVRLTHESSDRILNKMELIEACSQMDFRRAGDEYIRSVGGYERHKPLFIDKTPWNFLYLGVIAKALPAAKVVHVNRHPVDSCFALYKTLFRGGAPYSYDLEDLARYYIAYHRLMQHWRDALPGRFMEVRYEDLVQSPQDVTTNLLKYCGVEFEASCRDFHLNPEPAATASAAQVREPIHTRSVATWKKHQVHLGPLIDRLAVAGIACESQ